MHNIKEFLILGFIAFIGAFIFTGAAENVTDPIYRTKEAKDNFVDSKKLPLARIRLKNFSIKNSLDRFINSNFSDKQANLKNISSIKDSSEVEISPLNATDKEELDELVSPSTIFAFNTSQNLGNVKNVTEELSVRLNDSDFYHSALITSTQESPLSGKTSVSTPGVTDNSSSSFDKPSTKPSTSKVHPTTPGSVFQRSLDWMENRYTLNILVPVAVGCTLFSTIIITVAIVTCIKGICCRRKLRSKSLPDSLQNLKPGELERLLAESSEDEFWVTSGSKNIKIR